MLGAPVDLSLDAVIITVTDGAPRVLVVDRDERPALPAGPLQPDRDETLELAMRRCILEQTGLEVGHVEQLYTFGDLGRRRSLGPSRPISVAYLALIEESMPATAARWVDVYDLLPWEDHRDGAPAALTETLQPALDAWAARDPNGSAADRVQVAFNPSWDGVRVVERYELLYEAGLVQEWAFDNDEQMAMAPTGIALQLDHRRIATMALSRLRGKLTYRPLVFEVLPPTFTLLDLQRTVEAFAGVRLHKQNFRRLIERSGLVEGTGERISAGAGRPAELFRYRPAVQLERPRPGVGQPYRS